jgi:Holliday junction resolvase RusA-like endonuclease
MKFNFTVPGEPQGKGRARVTMIGGHARAYTPAKTANYENLVRLCWTEKYGNINPTSDPVRMEINAFYTVPKSASKKQRAAMLAQTTYPTKKPDADNIAKVIADSIIKLAYNDDTQIVDMAISKRYSERPCVIVALEELNE